MVFGIFVLNRVLMLSIFVLNRVSFLRQESITLFLDLHSDACGFNSARILNSKLEKEKKISIKMNLSETFLDKYTRE